MFDLFSAARDAIAENDPLAPILSLGLGVASSFGPCAAPRYLTLAACLRRGDLRPAAGFVGGIVAGYLALGTFVSLVAGLADIATWVYAALALWMLARGVSTLVRTRPSTCDEHDVPAAFGPAFAIGASLVFVISPCCTPFVAVVVAYASQSGRFAMASLLLGAFAAGHVLPLVAAALAGRRLSSLATDRGVGECARLAGAIVSIVLAAYYGVLA